MWSRPVSFFILLSLFASGCGRTSTPPAQKSPNGSMTLSTSVSSNKSDPTRDLCVVVDITDSNGKSLHHEVTPASDVQKWSIAWVSNDEILLNNSDVGMYHIHHRPDGSWQGELKPK
jgi:hypothetical protein